MLKIGVSATIGIAAIAAASGVSISSSARTRAGQQRGDDPHDEARRPSPTSAFSPVMRAASRIVSCCRRSCSKIALGLGSTKGLMSRTSTNHCHSSQEADAEDDRRPDALEDAPRPDGLRPHAGPSSATGERPRSASRTSVIVAKNCSASRTSSSRAGERDVDDLGDAPRARRHDDHALGEEHRLGDRVRDEHDRRARLRADADQLGLHALARHLVQRAEGLVHQQQRRPAREGAGDRDALLHPARELARAVLGEVGQPDELEQLERLRAPLRLADPVQAERQLDVALHRAPLEQPRRLEGDAVVLVQARAARRLAVDQHRALARLDEVGDDPQQRRLAAARRADQRDELARRDGQVDVGHGLHRARALAEALADALERDRRRRRHVASSCVW